MNRRLRWLKVKNKVRKKLKKWASVIPYGFPPAVAGAIKLLSAKGILAVYDGTFYGRGVVVPWLIAFFSVWALKGQFEVLIKDTSKELSKVMRKKGEVWKKFFSSAKFALNSSFFLFLIYFHLISSFWVGRVVSSRSENAIYPERGKKYRVAILISHGDDTPSFKLKGGRAGVSPAYLLYEWMKVSPLIIYDTCYSLSAILSLFYEQEVLNKLVDLAKEEGGKLERTIIFPNSSLLSRITLLGRLMPLESTYFLPTSPHEEIKDGAISGILSPIFYVKSKLTVWKQGGGWKLRMTFTPPLVVVTAEGKIKKIDKIEINL